MKFLSSKKQKKIAEKFFEYSFSDKEPVESDFQLLDSAASMHFLADIYNWDDGEEVLDWIISNPKCDKGTALLIFWRAQPDDYTCYENEKEADYNSGVFLMLKKIIKNFETDFYKKEAIFCDPKNEVYDINYKDKNAKWNIPDFMKQPTKGGKVYYLTSLTELYQKWMKEYKRKRGRKRHRKKLGIK